MAQITPLPVVSSRRVADIVAERLYEAGCRYAFGIPGGEVLTLVDALERAGIRVILVKHENGGGFMAEGVYHMTGAPAILLATIGPGAANAVNFIANALQDRVPVIFLTGCVDMDDAYCYPHQVFDHQALLRPITKESFRLTAERADLITDKALAIAVDDRPGPVHIDVPIGTAAKMPESNVRQRRSPIVPAVPAAGPGLDKGRRWIGEASNPLIIAGLDVLNHAADGTVRKLAERHRIPVITTYKGKGILPEDHRMSLGAAGLSPLADRYLMPMIQKADLVILVGYDPIEMRVGWRWPWNPAEKRVIDIAAVPNTHYMHQAGLNFVGDVGRTLGCLFANATVMAEWSSSELSNLRESLRQEYRVSESWGPSAIVDSVRKVTPANGIATVDSGAHRILLSQIWDCLEPHTLLQSSGLCTMGCAVPLAAGAKIAAPERDVVAFVGDAGLLMMLGELATIAEQRLAFPIVVFVDQSLALIALKQRGMQFPAHAVDFGAFDLTYVARGLGGQGVVAKDRKTLSQAIVDAYAADRFTLIACPFDADSYEGRL